MSRARAITTATPPTPTRRRPGRSTHAASAARSASWSPTTQARVLANFVGDVDGRDDPRRRHRHRPRGAAPGARRRQGHRRRRLEEMLAIARERAARAGATRHVPARRRARARFPDRSFDVGGQPSRADAHAAAGERCVAELCRVADRSRHRRLSVGAQRRRARSRWRGGVDARGSARQTEPYRVFTDGDDRRRLRAPRVPRPRRSIASSCCRSRCTRRSARARFTTATEALLDRAGLLELVRLAGHARRRTVRVLVTGATGFTGGHLARALAARGDTVSRAGPRRERRRAALLRPGIELVDRRSPRSRRRSRRAVAGVDVVYHIAAIYRQAGSRRRGLSRGQRRRRSATLIEAAARGRRPARRALQHGRRPRRRRASAGQRGRAAQAGRRLSGDEARRRAPGARGRRAARHRGHDRAADRHLRSRRSPPAEAVSRRRARAACHARAAARSITI